MRLIYNSNLEGRPMRKLINDPANVIREMLDGLLALCPGLARVAGYHVLVRADAEEVRDRQVAIVSGGGSGHEPAHAGYVGAGMLSAAVAGEIFTSPTVDSILAAIRAVAGRLGVLLVVKNYTGDRLNFGMAAELARAEGFLVDTVLVADDVALARSGEHAGRRGLAGTIFVHKIAGAAAAAGLDLPQVATVARAVANDVATMGVALSGGSAPTLDRPNFLLAENEIELGLGIHGERGVERMPAERADSLVDRLLSQILNGLQMASGERVAVLINNLGSTTMMELAIVARRAMEVLRAREIEVDRLCAGTFLSSLDMAGVSLSVLRMDDQRLKWLDAATNAPAWPRTAKQRPGTWQDEALPEPQFAEEYQERAPQTEQGRIIARAILRACEALLRAEPELTELDRAVGDGDLGHNMSRAATALRESLPRLPVDDASELLKALGKVSQRVLGGSSGPLYGVFFLRAGTLLEGGDSHDAKAWAAAALDGCEAISELGGARLGDRTMLDALVPFARTFAEGLQAGAVLRKALLDALEAARRSADETAGITARRGRASYLGGRSLGHPDPGAIAVLVWLAAVVEAIAE
jgi:dihydroxyacetone kinase